MGTISAGVGIISGLPIDDIVRQLIAIDARPRQIAENQLAVVQAQRTAFLELSARLLALRNSVSSLDDPVFFRASRGTSSNENIILPTVEPNAQQGSFSFQVHSLVRTHQLISRGLADADRTPVGAGRISVELGNGRLSAPTPLEQLNGIGGVGRGRIRITDRAGGSIDLDLTAAQTLDDVLDAINSQTRAGVRAAVQGDRLVLTDISGGTGTLGVLDLAGGHTAADLGIDGTTTGDAATLSGRDLVFLTENTPLDLLNDGNGVRFSRKNQIDLTITAQDGSAFDIRLDDDLQAQTRLDALNNGRGVRLGVIRITPRTGDAVEVDLSGASTIGGVKVVIEAALEGISVAFENRSGFRISLAGVSEPGADDPPLHNFVIEDVTGFAARDLGIAADVEEDTIDGNDIYRITTVGDVLRAINFGTQGKVVAELAADQGNGIRLVDKTSGAGTLTVVSPTTTGSGGGHAAEDLGLVGEATGNVLVSRDLLAGLNTVLVHSLNGGSGANLGALDVTLRDGTTASIDLSGAQTVRQIMDRINNAGLALNASLNGVATGIVLRDTSGGTGNLVVADGAGGTAATDLNLIVDAAVSEVASGNLQRQYISERTQFADLNQGRGINRGKFRITDATGRSAVIDLTQGNELTLADVIDEINARSADPDDPNSFGIRVTARINDTGDGLLLIDFTPEESRSRTLEVTEEGGGTVAAGLNILGTADETTRRIDGSYEITIDVDADDTLNDVVAKLNDAGANVRALVVNDGSSLQPFRLTLTSELPGQRGRILFDPGTTGLSLDTLIDPQDALVFLGSSDSPAAVAVTSSTNSLENIIRGVSLDLLSTGDQPVTVTVSRDIDSIVRGIRSFTSNMNDTLKRISELTRFDAKSSERGILQGDSVARLIQNRLFDGVLRTIPTGHQTINRLSAVGISVSGGRIRLDEDRLRKVLREDSDAVTDLFTRAEGGFGAMFDDLLDGMTRSIDGLLARQDTRLSDREELLNERIDDLQELLDLKEARLRAQFLAMERSLASLQAQQSALNSFTIIPPISRSLRIG